METDREPLPNICQLKSADAGPRGDGGGKVGCPESCVLPLLVMRPMLAMLAMRPLLAMLAMRPMLLFALGLFVSRFAAESAPVIFFFTLFIFAIILD